MCRRRAQSGHWRLQELHYREYIDVSVYNGGGPRESGTTALEIDDLTVAYNSRPAIWDIDLQVPEGVLMAIIGPNGAGKSTLIKAALKLIPRAAGTVQFLRPTL